MSLTTLTTDGPRDAPPPLLFADWAEDFSGSWAGACNHSIAVSVDVTLALSGNYQLGTGLRVVDGRVIVSSFRTDARYCERLDCLSSIIVFVDFHNKWMLHCKKIIEIKYIKYTIYI